MAMHLSADNCVRSVLIITSQMRAARALLGVDQRQLAQMASLSLPTIQRMESSGGQVRGIIDRLMKVVDALERAGVELIGENNSSVGMGRGVRLREVESRLGNQSFAMSGQDSGPQKTAENVA